MSNLIVVLFFSVQALSSLAFECSNNTQLTEEGSTDFSAYGAVTCSWVITVSDKYVVKLTIKSSRLDSSANTNCRNDYFQVRDGSNSSSTLLGIICDLEPGSSEYRSNGSHLWVEYKSTNPNNDFQASYKRILNQRYCPSDIICNETSGLVYSPFYPEDYPNDMDCSWNLIGPSGSHLIFTFDWICLGICTSSVNDCDKLTISDVYITKFLTLESNVEPSISRQNSIALSFLSDSEYTSKGFKAKYEVVFRDTACSQMIHLTNSSGWFASPNFPQDYPNGEECNWNISVPNGFKLFLTFLVFDIEDGGSSCTNDYVEVRYPPYTQAYAVRKCGNYPSRDWTVTSVDSLLVTFKSDRFGSKQGFEAVYVLRTLDAYDSVPSACCPLTYSPATDSILTAEDHVDEPITAIARTAAVSVDAETHELLSTSATSHHSTSSRNSAAQRSNIFSIALNSMTVCAISYFAF